MTVEVIVRRSQAIKQFKQFVNHPVCHIFSVNLLTTTMGRHTKGFWSHSVFAVLAFNGVDHQQHAVTIDKIRSTSPSNESMASTMLILWSFNNSSVLAKMSCHALFQDHLIHNHVIALRLVLERCGLFEQRVRQRCFATSMAMMARSRMWESGY